MVAPDVPFTTSTKPINSTSSLLKQKGSSNGKKYRHDDRYRAEIYSINALLRDHENGLYGEFIERMKTRKDSAESSDYFNESGLHLDDDDNKSTDSTIVPSPDNQMKQKIISVQMNKNVRMKSQGSAESFNAV